jgi:hypothetical protein
MARLECNTPFVLKRYAIPSCQLAYEHKVLGLCDHGILCSLLSIEFHIKYLFIVKFHTKLGGWNSCSEIVNVMFGKMLFKFIYFMIRPINPFV